MCYNFNDTRYACLLQKNKKRNHIEIFHVNLNGFTTNEYCQTVVLQYNFRMA